MIKINRVNFRDVQALNGLRLCGYAKKEDLSSIISSNRIKVMEKQGLIESKTNTRNETIYTYTDKGKSFIKNLDTLKGQAFYSRQTASTEHDTKLFSEYCKLTPTERMSCLSETQTRDIFSETLKQDQANAEIDKMYSIPDIVYTTDEGITIALEITTNNYTTERMELKENFCNATNIELKAVKV